MSVSGIVYLVNKDTRQVTFAGEVPPTYGNITGLSAVPYAVMSNLEQNFPDDKNSYQNLGFLTEEDALKAGVTAEVIAKMKKAAWELKWNSLDDERFELIENQRWRVNRYDDEVALGRTPTEDITPVRIYMQAIRDLPITFPDPFNMVWPTIPPLPA